jgi:hypothetical protein
LGVHQPKVVCEKLLVKLQEMMIFVSESDCSLAEGLKTIQTKVMSEFQDLLQYRIFREGTGEDPRGAGWAVG